MNLFLPTIQRGAQTARHLLLIGVCLAAFCAQLANADSLVALGQVNADGTLEFGHAESEATVTSVRDDAGDYSITIARPGLFAGAQSSDFIVELTPTIFFTELSNENMLDEVFRVRSGIAVSDDELTIRVHSTDVEEDGATSGTPRDNPFYFVIRRIPVSGNLSADTRFLEVVGIFRTSMNDISHISSQGLDVVATNPEEGVINISVTGARIQSGDQIVVQASVRNGFHEDEIVQTSAVVSEGSAEVEFYTLDVNTVGNINALEETDFSFAIYLIPNASDPDVKMRALQAIGRVGANGDLTNAATVEGLGFIAGGQNDTGYYYFDILASSGKLFDVNSYNEYTLILTPEGFGNLDEAIRGEIIVLNDTTLRLLVFVNDVEDTTSWATPNNAPFHFAVYYSGPTAVSDSAAGAGISSPAKATLLKKIKKLKKKAKNAKRKKQVAKAKKLKKQIKKLKKQLRAL